MHCFRSCSCCGLASRVHRMGLCAGRPKKTIDKGLVLRDLLDLASRDMWKLFLLLLKKYSDCVSGALKPVRPYSPLPKKELNQRGDMLHAV
jgi:hypothetical protein